MGALVNLAVGINVLWQGRVHGWMTQELNASARTLDETLPYQLSSPENEVTIGQCRRPVRLSDSR